MHTRELDELLSFGVVGVVGRLLSSVVSESTVVYLLWI